MKSALRIIVFVIPVTALTAEEISTIAPPAAYAGSSFDVSIRAGLTEPGPNTATWSLSRNATIIAQGRADVRDEEKRFSIVCPTVRRVISLRLDIALTKKSGDTASLARKTELLDWMTEARAAARGMTVEEFKKAPKEGSVDLVSADIDAVMKSLQSLKPKIDALTQVGSTLAALSKKDDIKARATFLVGYVKQVRAEIDKKEKAAAAAAAAAKATAGGAAAAAAEPGADE